LVERKDSQQQQFSFLGNSRQQVVLAQQQQLQQSQIQSFIPAPIPASLVEKIPALGKFAVFDCEWFREDVKENRERGIAGNIYTFCLVDGHGTIEKLHVDNFRDRREFMSTILDVLGRYDSFAGYAILNGRKGGKEFVSDLGQIVNNCKQVGLSDKLVSSIGQCDVLDVYKIFSNRTVKGFLKQTDVSYRDESLDVVALEYIGKGKTEGISGINVESLPIDKQLEYCLRDTNLCYELLQKNNFELLQILYEISEEIKLPFFDTCNTNYPTAWWEAKLRSIGYQKVSSDMQRWISENTAYKNGKNLGVKYLGGYVVKPQTGYHLGAVSYDVVSMYPTMINVKNISTETINCDCCCDISEARVPDEVMQSINDYLTSKKRPWHYWICQKRRGKLSDVMADLIKRKKEYKRSGQKLKEKAIKILMNSGYGCFGNAYFDYQDPRVAELITAYGQYTIRGFAESVGDENVIYGDTDSIYLASKNDTLIAEAAKINVDLEIDKEWKILFLSSNKKQYFGITQQGGLVYKTLTGMKSDHPAYFNGVAKKLISKEFQELFITLDPTSASANILTYIRSAFDLLQTEGSIKIEDLAYSTEASKNLYDYTSNGKEQKIYREILEDCDGDVELARSKSQAKHVYKYWKILGVKSKSVTIHPEKHELDIEKYKTELFTCIKPILAAYGIKDLEKLRSELITQEG
jgi:DNA polymerase elongation subunit (family B)